MKEKVYLVINDYTEDTGSRIYGVFSTKDIAKKACELLQDPERSPYGAEFSQDTIEVREKTITDDPTYV